MYYVCVCGCGCAHAAAQKMLVEKRAICFKAVASVPRQKGRGGNEAIVFTPNSSNTPTGRAHMIFLLCFSEASVSVMTRGEARYTLRKLQTEEEAVMRPPGKQ